MEQRMGHAKAQIESDMTQAEYAAKVGFPPSMIGYWIKQYRDKHNISTTRRTLPKRSKPVGQELTHDELSEARAEISSLLFVRDELLGKLEDAQTKIEALQNVVVVLGYQIGDK
jgi:transposase-like protein